MYTIVIGTAGCVIGTYLTPPTDRQVLEHFYRTTRPFGLWKPLFSILPVNEQQAMRYEHRYDLIALPIGLCWQFTLLMLPMQLVIHEFQAAAVTGAVFLLCSMGMYFFWYKKLPPATAG